MTVPETSTPDLGDLVVVLLASTLAGLRDRLYQDGFARAAELVGDLVEIVDDHLTDIAACRAAGGWTSLASGEDLDLAR